MKMDKNTFATYEYLQSNNPEAESDQFFVIQDDGTFLLNRQVQYVAEVQDVNEAIDGAQACAVFDVNPQQFFVDVSNNPELISVADNYIVPAASVPEEVNNLYGNSFLLQAVNSESTEQAEKDLTITVQFKEAEEQKGVDVVNNINKQGNACTEITLSDEQYTNLQQKGWVLIESNGKIFILDAFGLHEVTANNDLIQNLKDESKIDLPMEVDSTGLVKDNQTNPFNIESIVMQNLSVERETIDFPMKLEQNECETEDGKQNQLEMNVGDENIDPDKEYEPPATDNDISEGINETILHTEPQKYKSNKIKIFTKYSFKDIPDKIVLGKTRNGKKLVAKVVKRPVADKIIEIPDEPKSDDSAVEPIWLIAKPPETPNNENSSKDIDNAEFIRLMQRAVSGALQCSAQEVTDVCTVVKQLFQVPKFGLTVADRNIVITRVIEKTSAEGSSRSVIFVSGSVKVAEDGSLIFVHEPHLLQRLTKEYEECFQHCSSRSVLKPISEKIPDCKILQVHIAEAKHNGVKAISFILNERYLPCKKKYPRKANKLHACSACAAIFQSEKELADHQENHAMESDGVLTIDTDVLPKVVQTFTIMENRYYISNTSKGTEYCCLHCTKKFTKQSNCVRHIKLTHTGPMPIVPAKVNTDIECREECNVDDNCEKAHEDQEYIIKNVECPQAPYKCKMCSSAYFYSASLSKHISKTHIMGKVNTMFQI